MSNNNGRQSELRPPVPEAHLPINFLNYTLLQRKRLHRVTKITPNKYVRFQVHVSDAVTEATT